MYATIADHFVGFVFAAIGFLIVVLLGSFVTMEWQFNIVEWHNGSRALFIIFEGACYWYGVALAKGDMG